MNTSSSAVKRRKSRRAGSEDENILPQIVEVPSSFADVVTIFEQVKEISPTLYDVFFDFILPAMSRYVLDGQETLPENRPMLLLKDPRMVSANFKRFFSRSNGRVPTQAHKLICFLNYFAQALGYAPLRQATPEPSEAGDETIEHDIEREGVSEYEDSSYRELVELNSKDTYIRIARRIIDENIVPQCPPSEEWLDEEWWTACSVGLAEVDILETTDVKHLVNSHSSDISLTVNEGHAQYLPYNSADRNDNKLRGKTLLGLTTNKPFGDALGLGTGVEEAYAMEHPEVLVALALCEPTSTGLPLANREIISLVRLPRSGSSGDKKEINPTAECIHTLNEFRYPIPDSSPLGTVGVSSEARFLLLWLAVSVIGKPLLFWDRTGELKHSGMRIDIEEIKESLIHVVKACQLKKVLVKHVLG
ncbi:hypothetical protein Pmar_PMAR006300 [Perkinsus marinus ATCC 50983]|uniref:Uncharacterized protein n=1 Tax=Perkinsus marinus (strain ATCC 50983 / TXsc) TaxID=423536 RepID=C5LAN2_PERM5|nr:hypothetical protein Pmar_PMAR006300 [Perkinsus marinus ATCC 50983]EER06488.1 hypothetical protein Pmar_PMAR006300 [Perkinsus marinus ATCC 50983]|eukprot:XP_002774672.1 hypothetical protein Pmar_PMAR006300 [Perkinsus marinus ATCC 50983]